MTNQRSSHAERIGNFDFLRLILAYLVIFSHSFYQVQSDGDPMVRWSQGQQAFGRIAVCFFFAISGYMIAKSWCADPNPARFLWKRILRIYPALFIVSAVCYWILQPLTSTSWAPNFSAFLFNVLTLCPGSSGDMFYGTLFPGAMIGTVWTLPWEFACYLAVLVIGLGAAVRHRWLLAFAVAVALAANGLQLHNLGVPDASMVEGPYANWVGVRLIAYFLVGTLFFVFRDLIKFHWAGVLVCIGALALGFKFGAFGVILPLAGSYLLFAVGFSPLIRLPRLGGDYSYGVYLIGWPMALTLVFLGWCQQPYTLCAATLLGSTALAIPLWHFVEKRCLARKPVRLDQ